MNILTVIATFNCPGSCPYCYIDKLNLDRTANLKFSDELISIINLFDDVKISGGEPLLYPHIVDLMSTAGINNIETSFYCSDDIIEKIININKNIQFGVTFQGLSHFNRPKEKKYAVEEKIKRYIKYIGSLRYVIFIKNILNVENDINHLKRFTDSIELIPYIEKSDIDILKNDKNLLKKLKLIIEKFKLHSWFYPARSKDNLYFIGAYDYRIYTHRHMKKIGAKLSCPSLGTVPENCVNCLNFAGYKLNLLESREEFLTGIKSIKKMLYFQ